MEGPGLTHGNKRATDLTGFTKCLRLTKSAQEGLSLSTQPPRVRVCLALPLADDDIGYPVCHCKSDIAVNRVCSFSTPGRSQAQHVLQEYNAWCVLNNNF